MNFAMMQDVKELKEAKNIRYMILEYEDRQNESFKSLLQLGSQLAGGSIASILSWLAGP